MYWTNGPREREHMTDEARVDELLTRRVDTIYPSYDALKKVLMSGKKLKLYQGFDPTGSRLHLGHTIGMRNLQSFAELGHEVIVLFGTGTVLVGDPSQRDTGRALITQEEIEANLKTWKEQVARVIDLDKVEIRFNGDWLVPLTLKDIIHIASNISAAHLFKRESFTRRIEAGDPVWYHETMYPLLQGYDSVAMDVDLEIGGTDQMFNMLVGRELQKKINNREKYVMTNPMVLGTDGKQMSKSSGNCIWLDDNARDMYGKTMSLPDEQTGVYFRMFTSIPLADIDSLVNDPLTAKKRLAHEIAAQFHGKAAADEAQKYFEDTVQGDALPEDIPDVVLPQTGDMLVLDLLKQLDLGVSSGDMKRTVKQGGVKLNGEKLTDMNAAVSVSDGDVVTFGKRTYRRIHS